MSDISTTVMTGVISLITGGGLVGGVVALRKDRRDTLKDDMDYTKQFREIAKQEVKDTRDELATMGKKVNILEGKVTELERVLKVKDRVIIRLVEYIGQLRDVLDQLKPKHPLPEVPDELKEYIK